MTRKRFVKLLMAAGYDRNEANAHAADARKTRIKYSTAFIVRSKLNDLNISALSDAVRIIGDTAVKLAYALSKAAEAFTQAFSGHMEA